MGHITDMDENQAEDLREYAREKELKAEFFKMEEHAGFLRRKLEEVEKRDEKNRTVTMEDIQRLEDKIEKIMNRLERIFGNHALVEGKWIPVIKLIKGGDSTNE